MDKRAQFQVGREEEKSEGEEGGGGNGREGRERKERGTEEGGDKRREGGGWKGREASSTTVTGDLCWQTESSSGLKKGQFGPLVGQHPEFRTQEESPSALVSWVLTALGSSSQQQPG